METVNTAANKKDVTYHKLYFFTALKLLIEAETQLGFVTKGHLLGVIKEMERLTNLANYK